MSTALQPQLEVQRSPAADSSAMSTSPYVGLVPFSEADTEFFYGRKEESAHIAANLRAARLTLLYGPSGVGKSSVLRAGVVAPLRKIAENDLNTRGAPDFAIVFFSTWAIEPLNGLAQRIQKAVQQAMGQDTIDPLPPGLSLSEVIRAWTDRYGIELLIILDQFEEYFLYHAREDGPGTFAAELPQAVGDPTLRARFLLSMRDDALSRLDLFKGRIPALFDNRLQIDYLSLDMAREAIIEPVRKYNQLYAPADQPFRFDHELVGATAPGSGDHPKFLVDEVLSQVQVGKVSLGITGQGIVKKDEASGANAAPPAPVAIEAPYLQLVMTRIWNNPVTVETRELKYATLAQLGGAQKIVERHLDSVMERLTEEEQDVAAAIFYYLVTPLGTKIAHTTETLTEYTKLDQKQVKVLLDKLLKVREGDEKEETRILRAVKQRIGEQEFDAYEVHHDALARAVLGWSVKHKSETLLLAERRKQRRIIYWAFAIALVMILIAGTLIAIGRYYLVLEEQRNQKYADKVDELIRTGRSLESHKHIIEDLINLSNAGSTSEQKAAALNRLQERIANEGVDPQLKPLIESVLLDVAAKLKGTEVGQDAKETAQQINQPRPDTSLSPRVYIQIQSEDQRDLAKLFQAELSKRQLADIPGVRPKIIAPGIENVGPRRNLIVPELRYFHANDTERQIGEQLVEILNSAGLTSVKLKLVGGYENNTDIRPNHFELWLATPAAPAVF